MPAAQKIVIAGGGVSGMAMALAAVRRGLEPVVLEQHDEVGGGGSGFSIWSYAIRALLDNGVSQEAIDEAGSVYVASDIHNAKGELLTSLPIEELSQKHGASSYDMDRRKLIQVMAAALPEGVVRTGSKVVEVEQDADSATVLLGSGERVTGDVVVVAEGIHAALREQIAGPAQLSYSGYTGTGGIIPEAPHDAEPGHHAEVWARGAKGGLATVQGGGARWYMVHRCEAGAVPRKEEMVEEARGWYEPLAQAIEATPEDEIQTHEAWDLPPLERWYDGRVIMIGDAAHATTPLAAMGACMSIKDGDVLGRLLAEKDTVEEAFEAMEEERKAATEATVAGARKSASWAMMDSALGAWFRNELMKHMPAEKAQEIGEEMVTGGVTDKGIGKD
jgi:2-polyprenyl-6-methoxyphenol hydroxylase-like FAD-dependent oxidoreductase